MLNRLPTRGETVAGAAAGLLLSSVLGCSIWFGFRAAYHRPELLTMSLIALLVVLSIIFAWSSALFLRVTFGSPALPGFKGQVVMGLLMIIMGVGLCLAAVLLENERPLFQLSQGFASASMGLLWLSQARRRRRARV